MTPTRVTKPRRTRSQRGAITPGEMLDNMAREVLIAVRVAAHVTQKELAKRLDRPASYVSDIERGNTWIRRSDFVAYAEALGTDPRTLFAEVLTRVPDRASRVRMARKVAK